MKIFMIGDDNNEDIYDNIGDDNENENVLDWSTFGLLLSPTSICRLGSSVLPIKFQHPKSSCLIWPK